MLLSFCRVVASTAAASPGVHRATSPRVVVHVMADAKATAVSVGKDVLRVLHLLAVNLKRG